MDIEKLIIEWSAIKDEITGHKNIDFSALKKLFKETYNYLEKYRTKKLVPKKISKLIFVINDFGWTVSVSEKTPLHKFSKEILFLIATINKRFFTSDGDVNVIVGMIEKISDRGFKTIKSQ